jgi:hypothetical protein
VLVVAQQARDRDAGTLELRHQAAQVRLARAFARVERPVDLARGLHAGEGALQGRGQRHTRGRQRGEAPGPARRRAQQAGGEVRVVVEVGEQRQVLGLREHLREQRVDHRVQHQVVGRGDRGQPAGVAEQHVVQLVHHQHHQLLRGLGVARHETGVHQQPRLRAALHRGGGHRVGLHHV